MKSFDIADWYWKAQGLNVPAREYIFHPTRKWRIDFAWPEEKLAVEIEGGIYSHGRHTRATGFLGDIEKYNALTELNWSLLRYPADMKKIKFDQIRRVFNQQKIIKLL